MPTITGTNGDDNLIGTEDADTINALLGVDTVDGRGGSDTLIVDYSSAHYDPYAGTTVADVPSVITSNGGSFSGAVKTVDGKIFVSFSNIEHLVVKLDTWENRFIIDGSALAHGATIDIDGGIGFDTFEANLSALSSVNLLFGPGGTTASFGTIVNFEIFKLTLTESADTVTTGAGKDTLTGNGGDDVLNSGGGDDILSGGSGSNILNAGDGDDRITSSGVDSVDGGSGLDRWSGDYGSSSANFSMIRDQAAGTATLSNGTTLSGIELIEALATGSGNDVFNLTNEAVSISAGAGDDTLNLINGGFSGTITADGSGAFKGNGYGFAIFSGIEHLNLTSSSFPDVVSVNAAPLLSGASFYFDAAGGSDTLALDLSAFGNVSFVVAADGSLATNVPVTLLNIENYELTGGAGADNIVTGAGNDIVHGNGGNDVIATAGGNDLLDGDLGADAMTGGAGNDIYVVDDAGDTTVENAGEGTDEVQTALASFAIAANIENLTGTSDAGQTLTGNNLANNISGAAGNDTLVGGGGADLLQGKNGNDTYLINDAAAVAYELDGFGNDTVYTTVSYVLYSLSAVETLAAYDPTATIAINLKGSNRDQSIYGNAGANILDGGGGTDILIGLGGNDSYTVDSPADQVIEAVGGGTDTVNTLSNYTLGADSEIEFLTFSDPASIQTRTLTGNEFAQTISGNEGNNTLNGNGGNDVLVGYGGVDTLNGGAGDDAIYGGAWGDRLDGGSGSDRFYYLAVSDSESGAADWIKAFESGIDKIDLSATGATSVSWTDNVDSGTGAPYKLVTAVTPGGSMLIRVDGAVLQLGDFVMAPITGTSNDDVLIGTGASETINGLQGNDVLDGGGGDDALNGGAGNDVYYVNSAGDTVIEAGGEGTDIVYASVGYTLNAGAHVELLTTSSIAGTQAIDMTGNELDNTIWGNNGANTLSGGVGGHDTLVGFLGNDIYLINNTDEVVVENAGEGTDIVYVNSSYTLTNDASIELLSTYSIAGTQAYDLTGNNLDNTIWGNRGNNTLSGGVGGHDTLVGFLGNDIYLINNGDEVIVENAGEGTDIVYVNASYTLSANASIELLSTYSIAGTAAINLTGNNLDNTIWGNRGDNMLSGGIGGNDTLVGFLGNDTYLINNGNEVISELAGEGTDIVYASVNYVLTAGASIELLSTNSIGGIGGISLTGNELANTLWGNNGGNTLNGGAGSDTLSGFGGADTFAFTTALGAGNVDAVTDFVAGTEKIALDDAVFAGIGGIGALNANAFVSGSTAQDADDRILYDAATGNLFFDADGNGAGAAVLFANLTNHAALTAGDFMVI